MAVTKEEIGRWFEEGKRDGAAFMIVVVDTFDYEDYPVYVDDEEGLWREFDRHNNVNMQRVMEVYDLRRDKDRQLKDARAWAMPAKEK